MIRLDEQYPPLQGGLAQRPRNEQEMQELLATTNLWFDESRGLTRRPAMRLVSKATNGTYDNAVETAATWGPTTITNATYDALPDGTVRDHFELPYTFQSEDYSLFVQKDALGVKDAPAYAVRKSDSRRIVNPIPGAGVAAALANGANAAATVGGLLVIAPRAANRQDSHPTYTVGHPYAVAANQSNMVAWVRGGAFARPYRITLVRGDSRCWVEYTTLSEAYPGKLDTSDIPTTDPDYSKKVADRTNAYNAAATSWLAAALADITPENIAAQLAGALSTSGFLASGATATSVGASVLINDQSVEEIFVEDGGDGSLILAGGNTIPSAASVVAFHIPGKILRVLPGSEGGANSFYLKAVAKDLSQGAMTQVSWEECAGETLIAANYWVYGTIVPSSVPATYPEGSLHLALTIEALNAAAGTTFPVVTPNISGDMTTNRPPVFYTKEVSALASFQDRLTVVCAGGAVAASQPGDYLNFFRTSALTVLASDPVNFTIVGGEGDTVRHAVKYDRNLLLVGNKQYLLSGREPMVPGGTAATIFSTVPGMATIEPVVVEGSVFFARYNGGKTTLHAMQQGKIVEDPQVVDLTAQAPNSITLAPRRILATGTPDTVLLLTSDPRYSYLVTFRKKEGAALWPWDIVALSNPTTYWTYPSAGIQKMAACVGAYQHQGVFNFLMQRLDISGSAPNKTITASYHLGSLDFRARTSDRGYWDTRLGAVPFTGYGDWDTFSVNPAGFGEYIAQASLVPPTHYSDKGFRVPVPSTGTGDIKERRPLVVVDYRPHFSDTSFAKILLGPTITWWAVPETTYPVATGRQDGAYAYRQDTVGTPTTVPAVSTGFDFTVALPLGKLVHAAQITLLSWGKHPFTISNVRWTGAQLVRSDRG